VQPADRHHLALMLWLEEDAHAHLHTHITTHAHTHAHIRIYHVWHMYTHMHTYTHMRVPPTGTNRNWHCGLRRGRWWRPYCAARPPPACLSHGVISACWYLPACACFYFTRSTQAKCVHVPVTCAFWQIRVCNLSSVRQVCADNRVCTFSSH